MPARPALEEPFLGARHLLAYVLAEGRVATSSRVDLFLRLGRRVRCVRPGLLVRERFATGRGPVNRRLPVCVADLERRREASQRRIGTGRGRRLRTMVPSDRVALSSVLRGSGKRSALLRETSARAEEAEGRQTTLVFLARTWADQRTASQLVRDLEVRRRHE